MRRLTTALITAVCVMSACACTPGVPDNELPTTVQNGEGSGSVYTISFDPDVGLVTPDVQDGSSGGGGTDARDTCTPTPFDPCG